MPERYSAAELERRSKRYSTLGLLTVGQVEDAKAKEGKSHGNRAHMAAIAKAQREGYGRRVARPNSTRAMLTPEERVQAIHRHFVDMADLEWAEQHDRSMVPAIQARIESN